MAFVLGINSLLGGHVVWGSRGLNILSLVVTSMFLLILFQRNEARRLLLNFLGKFSVQNAVAKEERELGEQKRLARFTSDPVYDDVIARLRNRVDGAKRAMSTLGKF